MLERIENMINQLKEIQNHGIPVTFKTDDDGFLDRECPDETCSNQFKVLLADWTKLSDDASVYCPLCRHEAGVESWSTKDQLAHGRSEAIKYVKSKIGISSEKDYNIAAAPAITLVYKKEECEVCKSHYSVIGNAPYCPCCGNKSDNT
ncbi:hypothetical protein [Edaphocola aurantiacus]|uniref:hypothetical protein n=1 Tax=Edaphocola aurantiacus TaxID=2601682 RepID=UPI001C93A71D|nr:hypothetical protein [Edaphocola aurantiacus]